MARPTAGQEIRAGIRWVRRYGAPVVMGVSPAEFEAMVPHILKGAAMEDAECQKKRKERAMARTLKEPMLDPVARALDAAERPAREREAAERAQQAQAQQAEQRNWGVVAAAALAQLQRRASEIDRLRTRDPVNGVLLRDRHFGALSHEAIDRVFAQRAALDEMIGRALVKLETWRDELAGPMQPERLAAVIEGVRVEAQTWRSAASGLATAAEIRAQAVAALVEARDAHDVHIRALLDDPGEADTTPKQAA